VAIEKMNDDTDKLPEDKSTAVQGFEFPRSEREVVRVWAHRWKGRDVFSVHVFYRGKGGVWLPTRKGITMRLELIRKLIESLNGISACPATESPPMRAESTNAAGL
jgi:hypothetical protein